MLAVSNDLIDMIHTHPSIADGGPNVQFDLYFPREATYRIWVQFQRFGKVNTVFTIPVSGSSDPANIACGFPVSSSLTFFGKRTASLSGGKETRLCLPQQSS